MRLERLAISAALAVALTCVLTFVLGTAQAQAPLRLLVWVNGDKGYNGLQKVGDAFAQLSGVQVVVQHPEGAPDKFQAAAAAGKGPDVMCWAHDRVGEWAKSGLVVPIRPNKRIRSEIDDTAWSAFTYRGQVWGYPLAIETVGLIYNKALVPTPPESFDQVIELDRKLKAQGKSAILWAYNQSFFSWALLAGPGAFVFGRTPAGELDPKVVGVNNAGALKGAQMIDRLVKDGHMPKGARYSEMEGAFARGQVAMMINGPWAWDNVRKVGIDFTVAPIPGVMGIGGKPSKPFVGVLGCMITAPSKIKDVAREFLENHLLKVDSLKTIGADVPLGVPANKAYYAELSADPRIKATMDNARAGEPIPNIPEMGRFFPAMDAALEAITNGRQAPQDALEGAAARMLSQ